eukprot:COSAG06_NODE_66648_length_254_cov_0.374194_1_plen_42_part_10
MRASRRQRASLSARSRVRKNALFVAIFVLKVEIYPDRLGTDK